MIKEFAIEPAAINGWERLRYFVDSCGFSRGRVIAKFPQTWLENVDGGIARPKDQNQLKRINEMLERLRKGHLHYFAERDAARNSEGDWLRSALIEHERQRFDAIIAEVNTSNDPRIIRADDVNEGEPRWQTHTSRTIERAKIAEAVAPLLRLSRSVLLIDRYFDPSDPNQTGHRDVLCQIAWRIVPTRIDRFEYHFCQRSSPQRIDGDLKFLLPDKLRLSLIEWPNPKRFHNRFILTDRGGIQFGNSLSWWGEPSDQISLLSETVHHQIWDKFNRSPKAKLEIVGGSPVR